MTVKRLKSRLKGTKPERKKVTRKVKLVVQEKKVISLPSEKKVASFNLLDYIMLVYGREKIGKTTLFASFPDALFLTTEPGTKGLEIFEIQIDSWEDILQAVKLLEKNKKFKYIIIDTADRAYDMCLDWVCKERNIEYPGQDDSGREDFGKSWRAVKQEFTDFIHRIIRTGRGVGFTSHMKETEIKTRSGEKYDRIYPTIGSQARKVIEALVDLFFFADYIKDSEGNTQRVLITEGDESIWAGHRKCAGKMPRFLPLDEDDAFGVIGQAFRGEHPGIDAANLLISSQTTQTAAKFIRADMAEKAREKQTIKKERRGGGKAKKRRIGG